MMTPETGKISLLVYKEDTVVILHSIMPDYLGYHASVVIARITQSFP